MFWIKFVNTSNIENTVDIKKWGKGGGGGGGTLY